MANITRYHPTGGVLPLRDAMDRLFQEAVTWPSMWDRSPEGTLRWSLPSSLAETNDGYVFQVALPGVSADTLEITAQQNVLVLKGSYAWALPQDARSIWSNLAIFAQRTEKVKVRVGHVWTWPHDDGVTGPDTWSEQLVGGEYPLS